MKKRRIFVALPIPGKIKKEIALWQEKHSHILVRWIKSENLHITVVPPWYVTDEEFQSTVQTIKESVGAAESFSVRFDKVLFGPSGQSVRLIWAEGETPKEFIELKGRLEDALSDFVRKEKRPAKLHLTIARFKPGTLEHLPPLNGEIRWEFEIKSIDLMESILKRTGAEYSVLESFIFQQSKNSIC
ncbi:RNA 2',3'-cyclic phosphodiesterase [Patescibacteria group bacterium]|nr:RNA 2',3'-cyclic phosphodiesterase [Patescibacteria group bacterium]